jgi:hypothetical protein
MTRSFAVIASVWCLIGCTFPYRPAITPAGQPPFEGIAQILQASQQHDGDVLLVHGMCHHDFENWVKPINEGLASALGMQLALAPSDQGTPLGGGAMLYRGTLSAAGYRLRTHAVVWSPITDARKIDSLCYDVSNGNAICKIPNSRVTGERARINALLKDWLMDECLADAIYYVGDEGRPKIQEAIAKAVSIVLSGQPDEPCKEATSSAIASAFQPSEQPLIIITQSLGSKMLFDTLIEMTNRCAQRAGAAAQAMKEGLKRPVQVFMLANQIPILSLAYSPRLNEQFRTAVATGPRSGIADILSLTKAAPRFRPLALGAERQVVAFSDPSDVLSYTLRTAPGQTPGVDFDDVLVTNVPVWFTAVEWPVDAHLGYPMNSDVMNAIACGSVGLLGPCPTVTSQGSH